MKKFWCVFLICLLILPSLAARKKVAVVLSGGGAKGTAHIGVLKVIREAGIPVDYVVGTSMGAIVGGLYAIGYTPHQLDSAVNAQNWLFLFSDKLQFSKQTFYERAQTDKYLLTLPFSLGKDKIIGGGVISGQNLSRLFSDMTAGYTEPTDFNKLPIPFACVATNVVDGKEVVFHEGVLPVAMRASMAIPAVFTPVRMDSMVLVDGGVVNNFPVNVAKQMGADLIIGVDLQTGMHPASDLTSTTSILGQIIDMLGIKRYEENKKMVNVYIHPDVKGFTAASFSKSDIDTLIVHGEQAARAKWKELIDLKKEIGVPEDYVADTIPPYNPDPNKKDIYLSTITFTGVEVQDRDWLLRQCGLEEHTTVSVADLNRAVAILSRFHANSNVTYELVNGPKYDLEFKLGNNKENTISFGLRFDSEDIGALLINATTNFRGRIDSRLSLTGRLGKNLFLRADYSLLPLPERSFNFAYMFRYNDVDIYRRGKRIYNTSYRYHLGEVSFANGFNPDVEIELGLRYEYYDYDAFLFSDEGIDRDVRPQGCFSYYARVLWETLNQGYFPTKGISGKLGCSVYTDNMVHYKGHAPFAAIDFSLGGAVSFTKRFTVLPSFYGRVLTGPNVPYPYLNAMGGFTAGRYLPQQLPFVGISHVEITNNALVIAKLQLRQRIAGKNYVSLIGNYGIHEDDFFNLFDGRSMWGAGISYAYDSLFGPLQAAFSWSNQAKKLYFYVSLGYIF